MWASGSGVRWRRFSFSCASQSMTSPKSSLRHWSHTPTMTILDNPTFELQKTPIWGQGKPHRGPPLGPVLRGRHRAISSRTMGLYDACVVGGRGQCHRPCRLWMFPGGNCIPLYVPPAKRPLPTLGRTVLSRGTREHRLFGGRARPPYGTPIQSIAHTSNASRRLGVSNSIRSRISPPIPIAPGAEIRIRGDLRSDLPCLAQGRRIVGEILNCSHTDCRQFLHQCLDLVRQAGSLPYFM
jgi:hypothetical protein